MAMWCCERLYIAVHDSKPPTEEEWERWLDLCRLREGRDMRCLVDTRGGGPDPRQRKQLAEVLQKLDGRSAIVTDSLLVRGIITALAWLGAPVRGFKPDDEAAAVDFLELTIHELRQVHEHLPQMRGEVGVAGHSRAASS